MTVPAKRFIKKLYIYIYIKVDKILLSNKIFVIQTFLYHKLDIILTPIKKTKKKRYYLNLMMIKDNNFERLKSSIYVSYDSCHIIMSCHQNFHLNFE